MLTCRDPWSSLDSQDFRYNAGDGRLGAEIETLSEVSFSWALVSFASSVTFDLSLEDLIQGLGDTDRVLVEGWEGGASGRVKSQLPSLRLGLCLRHNLHPKFPVKTGSCFPLHRLHDIWPRLVSSFLMSCFPWDPLISLQEFFFFFLSLGGSRSSLLLRTSIFAASRGSSVIAVHWFSFSFF